MVDNRMMAAHTLALCRTPPIPRKNPKRYLATKPLPPLPVASPIQPELLPKPLFSGKKTRPQPTAIQSAAAASPSPVSSSHSSASTPTAASWRSCRSSIASDFSSVSTPATSVANSPAVSRTQSLHYATPSPRTTWLVTPIETEVSPKPSLRRRKSPRKDTLRTLREREMGSLSEEGW